MTTPPTCAHQPRKNEGRPHPADSHGFSAHAPECLQAGLRAHGRCALSKENTSASRLPDGAAPDKIRNTNPSVAAVFAVKRGCMKCRHPITVAGAAKACSTVDRSTLFPFHPLAWTPADACRAQAFVGARARRANPNTPQRGLFDGLAGSARIHSAICSACCSVMSGWRGMMLRPHSPAPPSRILPAMYCAPSARAA